MFDVLTYVYEHFYIGDCGPEPDALASKLGTVGFEAEAVSAALTWMRGLRTAANQLEEFSANSAVPDAAIGIRSAPSSIRIYPAFEQRHLGTHGLGFLAFLESSGDLPASLRELVIERALATPLRPLALEDLKVIVLMVYWSVGFVPSALILDELVSGCIQRVLH